ncbi:hypothetical protein CDL12_25060 [Handroanthus impetiginosus]|uniref:Uncharacterized protein n=1 Tax=Handroanthus impetiginosus TaxID=429701 RepID=A0A2G9GAW5_9LAMI|nr:hypothetical protein CDL12_25060 [Handroanthus impetiginosus]
MSQIDSYIHGVFDYESYIKLMGLTLTNKVKKLGGPISQYGPSGPVNDTGPNNNTCAVDTPPITTLLPTKKTNSQIGGSCFSRILKERGIGEP